MFNVCENTLIMFHSEKRKTSLRWNDWMRNDDEEFMATKCFPLNQSCRYHLPVASVVVVPVGEEVVEERIPLSCGPTSLDWGSWGSGLRVECGSSSFIPSPGISSSSKRLNESGWTKSREKMWILNLSGEKMMLKNVNLSVPSSPFGYSDGLTRGGKSSVDIKCKLHHVRHN